MAAARSRTEVSLAGGLLIGATSPESPPQRPLDGIAASEAVRGRLIPPYGNTGVRAANSRHKFASNQQLPATDRQPDRLLPKIHEQRPRLNTAAPLGNHFLQITARCDLTHRLACAQTKPYSSRGWNSLPGKAQPATGNRVLRGGR